ncbi:unnamed protein product [Candida verbasci]|uniref:Major facilitator superfamily (MFS) profile domain-containing protein n=1 Tax=Candida verbasci TaxID=1227364 RepID=A0A9W4TW10_9ASCO|nr:unnamed protein product [Candida verbasci]
MTKPKLTFKEQMKGFPYWQMVIVCIIRIAEPICFTSLFPYVFFMIRDFKIAKNPADIATYSGYLSASFALMQCIFCVQWGKATDKYGRKIILMIGLTGTGISMLIFGFSPNFYVAMFARCLMGSLNGNIAVLRTCIGEIATEKRHQAIAFSTLPLLWNVGSVIGASLGGSKYLTRPKDRSDYDSNDLNDFYNSFMDKFPYALSNIVVATILFASLLMGWLFLEETHEKYKSKKDHGIVIGDFILRRLGFNPPVRPWDKAYKAKPKQTDTDESTPLLEEPLLPSNALDDDNVIDEEASIHSYDGPITRRYSNALIERYNSSTSLNSLTKVNSQQSIKQSFNKEIFTHAVIQTLTINFLLSFHNVIYSEFLPVLLAGSYDPKKLIFPSHIAGGFGYNSDFIGKLLSTTGLIGACGIMFIFPILDRHFKSLGILQTSSVIFPLTYTILPYIIFTKKYDTIFPAWSTKVLLYSLACLNTAFMATGFPTILILIHRAANSKHSAFINATALSLNSLARFIAPVLWGYVIALCDSFEVGQISWMLLGGLSLIGCIFAFSMKDYDDDDADEESK